MAQATYLCNLCGTILESLASLNEVREKSNDLSKDIERNRAAFESTSLFNFLLNSESKVLKTNSPKSLNTLNASSDYRYFKTELPDGKVLMTFTELDLAQDKIVQEQRAHLRGLQLQVDRDALGPTQQLMEYFESPELERLGDAVEKTQSALESIGNLIGRFRDADQVLP